MYIYIYISLYICTYIYVYIHIYMYLCISICIYTFVCVSMRLCVHTYLCTQCYRLFSPFSPVQVHNTCIFSQKGRKTSVRTVVLCLRCSHSNVHARACQRQTQFYFPFIHYIHQYKLGTRVRVCASRCVCVSENGLRGRASVCVCASVCVFRSLSPWASVCM